MTQGEASNADLEPSPAEPEPASGDAETDEPVLVLGAARPEMSPRFDEFEAARADDPENAEPPRTTCLYCGGSLPTHRTINFCPHCGQSQIQILCPECRSEVEPGWRHCVNCGAAVGEA